MYKKAREEPGNEGYNQASGHCLELLVLWPRLGFIFLLFASYKLTQAAFRTTDKIWYSTFMIL